jgi:hypothetical protein
LVLIQYPSCPASITRISAFRKGVSGVAGDRLPRLVHCPIEQTTQSKRRLWVLNPRALPAFLDNEPKRLADDDVKLASFHLSRFIRSGEAVRR